MTKEGFNPRQLAQEIKFELPFGYFKALRQGKKEGCSCVRKQDFK